jgi:MATE family multidrug resistance protein
VFSGVFLSSIYAVLISLACLVETSAMIGVFLTSEASAETRELALWGTQLNAVMMFTFAWSAVLAGGLRGVGDTYGVMTTSAVFWWSQYLLVHVLINQFQLAPAEVLGVHAFSSPLLCVMMLARFRGGPWRKLRLAAA